MATVTVIQFTGPSCEARAAIGGLVRPGRVLPARFARHGHGRHRSRSRGCFARHAGAVAREAAVAALSSAWACLWARLTR